MNSFRHTILGAVMLVFVPAAPWALLAAQDTLPPVRGYLADSTLAFLEPMIGSWQPMGLPDSLMQLDPPIVGHDYQWTVGRKAIRLRESFRLGDPDAARLDGLVYWNPATERIEFTAVAGPGPGQGRLFKGVYRQLENGTIERTYDVFYRTLADMPAEVFGGSRRTYRERYTFLTPDSVASQLDWFHDGAWRGFGPFATGSFRRLSPRSRDAAIIAEVEAATWAFHAADTARSADGVIALLWPEYTMLVDGRRVEYDDIVAGSRAFMSGIELFHTEWTDLQVTPVGPHAALASFVFRDSIVTKAGDVVRHRGPTTFLWERRNGEWRLLYGDSDHYPLE